MSSQPNGICFKSISNRINVQPNSTIAAEFARMHPFADALVRVHLTTDVEVVSYY